MDDGAWVTRLQAADAATRAAALAELPVVARDWDTGIVTTGEIPDRAAREQVIFEALSGSAPPENDLSVPQAEGPKRANLLLALTRLGQEACTRALPLVLRPYNHFEVRDALNLVAWGSEPKTAARTIVTALAQPAPRAALELTRGILTSFQMRNKKVAEPPMPPLVRELLSSAGPELKRLAESEDTSFDAKPALAVCVKFGKAALAPLLASLDGASEREVGDSARALRELGPAAAPAAKKLTALLSLEHAACLDVAGALAAIGPPAKAALPKLVKLHALAAKRGDHAAMEALARAAVAIGGEGALG